MGPSPPTAGARALLPWAAPERLHLGPCGQPCPSCAGASVSNTFKPPLVPPTHPNNLCFRIYIIY